MFQRWLPILLLLTAVLPLNAVTEYILFQEKDVRATVLGKLPEFADEIQLSEPVIDKNLAAEGWRWTTWEASVLGYVDPLAVSADLSIKPGTPVRFRPEAGSPVFSFIDGGEPTEILRITDWVKIRFRKAIPVYFVAPDFVPRSKQEAEKPTPVPATNVVVEKKPSKLEALKNAAAAPVVEIGTEEAIVIEGVKEEPVVIETPKVEAIVEAPAVVEPVVEEPKPEPIPTVEPVVVETIVEKPAPVIKPVVTTPAPTPVPEPTPKAEIVGSIGTPLPRVDLKAVGAIEEKPVPTPEPKIEPQPEPTPDPIREPEPMLKKAEPTPLPILKAPEPELIVTKEPESAPVIIPEIRGSNLVEPEAEAVEEAPETNVVEEVKPKTGKLAAIQKATSEEPVVELGDEAPIVLESAEPPAPVEVESPVEIEAPAVEEPTVVDTPIQTPEAVEAIPVEEPKAELSEDAMLLSDIIEDLPETVTLEPVVEEATTPPAPVVAPAPTPKPPVDNGLRPRNQDVRAEPMRPVAPQRPTEVLGIRDRPIPKEQVMPQYYEGILRKATTLFYTPAYPIVLDGFNGKTIAFIDTKMLITNQSLDHYLDKKVVIMGPTRTIEGRTSLVIEARLIQVK